MKILRFLLVAVFALASSGCMLLSGRCIYEIRALEATGETVVSGTAVASARVTYGERRESDPDRHIYYVVESPTLKGHVLSATLKRTGSSSSLLNLALAPSVRTAVVEGGTSEMEGADLDGFWTALSSEEAFIELVTDQGSTISIPLEITYREDWSRPYCS